MFNPSKNRSELKKSMSLSTLFLLDNLTPSNIFLVEISISGFISKTGNSGIFDDKNSMFSPLPFTIAVFLKKQKVHQHLTKTIMNLEIFFD